MLHRRRVSSRSEPVTTAPTAHGNGRSSPTGLARLFGGPSSSNSRNSGGKDDKTITPLRRLVYILIALVTVFMILHYASNSSSTRRRFGMKGSRRTDALVRQARKQRASAAMYNAEGGSAPTNFSEAPPFTFCPSYGSSDELGNKYGREAISKTRSHVGSSARVQKVIKRAMAGLPITVGVLGGSISSCHGLDASPAHPLGNPIGPNCYPHRVFSWLNDVFPHPANELTNGALRRTGTSYYGFCSDMHLPDRVDLVIVEFDTEDPHDPTSLSTTDLLIRSLLLRSDHPAVIMLGHFAPQIQGEYGFAGPEIYHTTVAQFYDVVHLTIKGLIYEEYLLNPQKVRSTYFLDPILANAKGHELLADTVISFLEAQVCQVWDQVALQADIAALGGSTTVVSPLNVGEDFPSLLSGKGLRKSVNVFEETDSSISPDTGKGSRSSHSKIPPFRLGDRPHTLARFREIKPNCASANDLINPLPPSVFTGSGWSPIVPKPEEEDETHYWYSDAPGSLLKIPIKCGAGDIAVYYYKGPAAQGWGNVLCWVDDNTAGAVELKGSWDKEYGQPTVTQIDQAVTKGSHFVVCELQGQPGVDHAQFKLFGIFST
ncbi:BQ2448_4772 [Microbotryum intermedium]|uniref:BQ2448_4772 protein n=1 Tax=Microbotryum intermedium TaxID=269621 RepID=A0A238FLN1_9BASI|nr:BQ2448_4772 [Microbotryum intermedium]